MDRFAYFLHEQPLPLIAATIFAAQLLARELGGWVHHRVAGPCDGPADEAQDKSYTPVLGYALAGARARHRPATTILFALLTLAILLILDLDHPQRGTIRIDQTSMIRLVSGFAPRSGRRRPRWSRRSPRRGAGATQPLPAARIRWVSTWGYLRSRCVRRG